MISEKKRFTGSCSGQNQNNLYRHAGLVIARPVPPSHVKHAQSVKAKKMQFEEMWQVPATTERTKQS